MASASRARRRRRRRVPGPWVQIVLTIALVTIPYVLPWALNGFRPL